MTYSALEKHREATREAAMRRSVYERRVESQQMSRKDADRKIAIMEEIASDYLELAGKERLL
jgi:hypothetical protein